MQAPEQTVLVTGASRGLGLAIVGALLEQGLRVVGVSRGESHLSSASYMHYRADILEPSEVSAVFKDLRQHGASVDILINNAGVLTSQYALILDPERAKDMVLTNLWAPFVVAREAARMMRKRGWGRLIHVGSMAPTLEVPGDSIYAASKQGLITLSNVLARELAGSGITSNVLGVSAFDTDMLAQLPQESLAEALKMLPLPRKADVDDVMNVIEFFMSARSDYITAQTIYLAGAH
jgi:3-oxoacyl-[acyl-carrier protein] reductase